MSRITREEVERVAALARLELGPDEAQRMTRELDAILDYVALLAEIDTTNVAPTAHAVPMATPLREDRPGTPLDPGDAVRNAPAHEGSAFLVPKVIEGEES